MTNMKVVILAGGKGTRMMEVTRDIPKPMVEIGDKPILDHIIDIYSQYGFNEFIVAGGYKIESIAEWFSSHYELSLGGQPTSLAAEPPSWYFRKGKVKVHLQDTGVETQTGGRIARLAPFLRRMPFMVTYGDGLSDVNIDQLLDFHVAHPGAATVTVVRPKPRFGAVTIGEKGKVTNFGEKQDHLDGWINGGFMVFQPEVLNLIDGDDTNLESDVLPDIAELGWLYAYRHEGFWECVDTLRDVQHLNEIYSDRGAVWKTSG